MLNKDSIILGIIIGLAVPFVGFAVIQILFEEFVRFGLMEEASQSISSRRMRTIALLAICMLIIPIQIYKKKRYDQTIRGISFPFLLYVGLWVYYFRDVLFGS